MQIQVRKYESCNLELDEPQHSVICLSCREKHKQRLAEALREINSEVN